MAWEKVKVFELASVDTQVDDLVQPIGGRSIAGTLSDVPSPLVDSMVWDCAAVGLSTTIVGGSFNVEVMTTIDGVTFPVLRRNAIAAGFTAMTNLMGAGWIPNPTMVAWDETAAGGITATVVGIFKTERGALKGAGNNSKKVVIGKIIATIGDIGTTQANGVTNADRLIALSPNPASSPFSRQNASTAGSQQYDLWDCGGFFMRVIGASGSYAVTLLSVVNGQTLFAAAFPAVTGVTRVTAVNTFNGPMPRPTHILFDAPSGGAVGLTADIYFIGKGTRGRRFGS